MLKRLLLLLTAALICHAASAQLLYSFTDTTSPYVPLSTGAASLNGSTIWSNQNYVAPMPFSWKLDSTITLTSLPLILSLPATCSDTANRTDINGFMFADLTLLTDRGALGTTSLSPIRYATTGTAPARIFKLEFANAGFAIENGYYGTLKDSINIQIWIYEGSSIVELHYGSSGITHPVDYFANGAGRPFIGYIKHLDIKNSSSGFFYYIRDSSAITKSLDTFSLKSTVIPTNSLSAWPANGRVFRFTPSRPACTPPVATFTAGAPSGKSVTFSFTGATAGLDSLVWDFGDGVKQTVTSAFAAPLTHTYAVNGRYSVTLTAYNSCASATAASQQSAVSVGSMGALRGVAAYPNPACNVLSVEGLAGGSVCILSLTGQVLLHAPLRGTHEALNISALPAGTYTLLLSSADGAVGAMPFSKL